MASLLKLRSVAVRSSALLPKNVASRVPFCSPATSSSTRTTIVSMSRVVVTIGCGESLLPLHSAVAATRLRSNIGVNSASWSCLSQGLTLTL